MANKKEKFNPVESVIMGIVNLLFSSLLFSMFIFTNPFIKLKWWIWVIIYIALAEIIFLIYNKGKKLTKEERKHILSYTFEMKSYAIIFMSFMMLVFHGVAHLIKYIIKPEVFKATYNFIFDAAVVIVVIIVIILLFKQYLKLNSLIFRRKK